MRTAHVACVAVAVGLAVGAVSPEARAVSIIHDPHPPEYKVEIEPHLDLNGGGVDFLGEYHSFGIGPGVRFSIPLMSPGFIKSINDSIAITFGADLIHYDGYYYCFHGDCFTTHDYSFWALYAPVALQWNFWLSDKWSVFGEPGLSLRHGFYGSFCDNTNNLTCSRDTLLAAFYGGARFHFADTTALTLRVGYPTGLSIGLSFF